MHLSNGRCRDVGIGVELAQPGPTAQSVRDRVVADFEGADADPAKFDTGVLKLIAALKK